MARKDSVRLHKEAEASSSENLAFIQYEDVDYKYFCEALPGTPLTDAEWRISRMHKVDMHITWCEGNTGFDKLATDVDVVAGLAFL